ncbi:phosphatase PAP2 family protein [Hymenobacter psychrophilus]|uniref:PAP2 superfamily protein n=1 Tax=Hymenobacter psychrophilus TaxID=651662 RepID=A0A1H3ELX9_9BACT|nr:phosphatase PAP2 family protein [Hymenobacter psychrophilus]SDX79752.1 PAP2 superfamily protein [Hymenobacter psychrophilus]
MKKRFTPLLLLPLLPLADAQAQRPRSPYRTQFSVDAPVTAGLGALSGLGLLLISKKNGLDLAGLAALNKQDVPKFDRFSAGNYSSRAQTASDFIVYPTLLLAPGLLALDSDVRNRYGQVLGLYLQTMAASNAAFTLTAGNVYRYRPYLYGPEGDSEKRTGNIATNSFFAGHTANTAAATFFAAKVYHDFNPGSAARPFVWGAAALVPAATGYFRLKAGKHFLSDNIVGYTVGAAVGILVPQLHKTTSRTGLAVFPVQGLNVNGHAYSGLGFIKQL